MATKKKAAPAPAPAFDPGDDQVARKLIALRAAFQKHGGLAGIVRALDHAAGQGDAEFVKLGKVIKADLDV